MKDLPTSNFFERVSGIIESAQSNVVRTVNHELVIAYWTIGREIVLELQGGESRSTYGKQLIQSLADHLVPKFGKHFNYRNLNYFRQFYIVYQKGKKLNTPCSQSEEQNLNMLCSDSQTSFSSKLSWSHYRLLMRVENSDAREFYESEAEKGVWSVRQLDRQIQSLFYERLLKSHDKQGMLRDVSQDQNQAMKAIDVIKDPYVLEFLDLPVRERLQESDLEEALIQALQNFLLELGSGFAFVGRQQHIALEGDSFYPDLVFYHIRLRCYLVIDLKVEKLTHGDIGQMQMYVGYYDREVCSPEDNPTIGLILCSDKNDAIVRYILGEQNEQIFASRYRLELPDEETLLKELERERQLIEGSEEKVSKKR